MPHHESPPTMSAKRKGERLTCPLVHVLGQHVPFLLGQLDVLDVHGSAPAVELAVLELAKVVDGDSFLVVLREELASPRGQASLIERAQKPAGREGAQRGEQTISDATLTHIGQASLLGQVEVGWLGHVRPLGCAFPIVVDGHLQPVLARVFGRREHLVHV